MLMITFELLSIVSKGSNPTTATNCNKLLDHLQIGHIVTGDCSNVSLSQYDSYFEFVFKLIIKVEHTSYIHTLFIFNSV